MGIADLFLIGTAGSLAGETLSLLENSPVVTWRITLSQRLFIYLFIFIYMNAYTSIHMWNISFHMCYQPLSNSILYSMFFFLRLSTYDFFCVKYIGIAMV